MLLSQRLDLQSQNQNPPLFNTGTIYAVYLATATKIRKCKGAVQWLRQSRTTTKNIRLKNVFLRGQGTQETLTQSMTAPLPHSTPALVATICTPPPHIRNWTKVFSKDCIVVTLILKLFEVVLPSHLFILQNQVATTDISSVRACYNNNSRIKNKRLTHCGHVLHTYSTSVFLWKLAAQSATSPDGENHIVCTPMLPSFTLLHYYAILSIRGRDRLCCQFSTKDWHGTLLLCSVNGTVGHACLKPCSHTQM